MILTRFGCEDGSRLILLRVVSFRGGVFSSLVGVLVGGSSTHNNVSTSAAFCALNDYVGDRNRVTGYECIFRRMFLDRFHYTVDDLIPLLSFY